MERRYAYLRPAPSSNNERSSASQSVPSADAVIKKRRRVGIAVACDSCRRKKSRCDGGRPVCSMCRRDSKNHCSYQDGQPSSKHLVVDAIRMLNAMPSEHLVPTLNLLKNETDPQMILSILEDGGIRLLPQLNQGPEDRTGHDPASDVQELHIQNTAAYPILDPIKFQSLNRRALYRTISPGISPPPLLEVPSTSESSPSHQSTPLGWLTPQQVGRYEPVPSVAVESPRDDGPSRGDGPALSSVLPAALCDERLRELDIIFWTDVPIDNTLASHVISLYLETDHPLLAPFDPDLFVKDLVGKRYRFCSRILVNALMSWACQIYAAREQRAAGFAPSFLAEAETLWRTEPPEGTILTLAATEYLSLTYLGRGEDHATLRYLAAASKMGSRMGLFGVTEVQTRDRLDKLPPEERSAHQYASWGVFNWIILMSVFYQQPGIECPLHSPLLPIPGSDRMGPKRTPESSSSNTPSPPSSEYLGRTFPYLCQFWNIMHEVSLKYYQDSKAPIGQNLSLPFAEYKFRELLAWSSSLPTDLLRSDENPHHVLIMHLWLHAAILDIFRPSMDGAWEPTQPLRTFANVKLTSEAVYKASVRQLKRLIVLFRLHYASSAHSLLWQHALIYVVNALFQDDSEDEWFRYFLVCLYGYERLSHSWRVAKVIMKGLLSMSIRKGGVKTATARRILEDLESSHHPDVEEIRATFMGDLGLAMSDPESATVENLAADFEQNAWLRDYTHIFDKDRRN